MDGIEKITGRIAADAGREIDDINAQARSQADEILARYEAQAKRESEEILARGRRNADERVEQLVELPEKEYVDLLADLAVKASSTGREAVIFSQKDRARYGKAVVTQANERLKDGHLTMSEQSRPIKGGLILSDGDVEVNCTFETLVRLQRGEMDREVAKVLFD